MSHSNQNAYINHRLVKADETYNAALVPINNEQWNSAINRSYYSWFLTATSLLSLSISEPISHTGAKILFFLHYIKTSKISTVYGKLHTDFFERLQKGDCSGFFDLDKDEEPWLAYQESPFNPSRKLFRIPVSI